MPKRLWLAVVAGSLMAAPAVAVPIAITNTGVDTHLVGLTTFDSRWDFALTTGLVYVGETGVGPAAAGAPGTGSASDAFVPDTMTALWFANDAVSSWITPVGPAGDQELPAQYYTYSTSFDLTTTSGAELHGRWASDNQTYGIYLNGSLISGFATNCLNSDLDTSCFEAFDPFSVNSGFAVGTNTLEFVILNIQGPSGLRVEVEGSVGGAEIPEPATLLLLGSGLTGLALRRRRRSA